MPTAPFVKLPKDSFWDRHEGLSQMAGFIILMTAPFVAGVFWAIYSQ